jgi:outer membrane protein assembly factor BamD
MLRCILVLLIIIFIGNCTMIQSLYTKPVEQRYDILSMAPQDKLILANSYFKVKKYDKAIIVYKDFERLHPTNKDVPYSIYQQGLGYYNQKLTFDRDQTYTTKALTEFDRLKQRFPKYEYISQVDTLIAQCRNDLAKHEFYVAEFYYKTKHYQGAIDRYRGLIKEYPEFVGNPEAKKKIEECKVFMTVKSKPVLWGLFDPKW